MDTVNCLKCNKRHPDNGNCTVSGGFCTAVQAAHCELLKEYLDTGKTPYEVNCLNQFAMGKMVAQIKEFNGVSIDRLQEIAEADKNWRVAILPCEVGGSLLDVSDPEHPREMKDVHFSVSYVSSGIVFSQPLNIFRENIAAGYIKPWEVSDNDNV